MIEIEKLQKYLTEVDSDVDLLSNMSQSIVENYAKDLDDEMKEIYQEVVMSDYPDINTLEKHFTKLTSIIYFVVDKVERLGIYDDISKSKAKEAFNTVYLNSIDSGAAKKPTAAELTATAENSTILESTTNQIYSRSYKVFKAKVDAAQSMVSTLSKIISKRMQETTFTDNTEIKQTKQILNESNNIFN